MHIGCQQKSEPEGSISTGSSGARLSTPQAAARRSMAATGQNREPGRLASGMQWRRSLNCMVFSWIIVRTRPLSTRSILDHVRRRSLLTAEGYGAIRLLERSIVKNSRRLASFMVWRMICCSQDGFGGGLEFRRLVRIIGVIGLERLTGPAKRRCMPRTVSPSGVYSLGEGQNKFCLAHMVLTTDRYCRKEPSVVQVPVATR